MNSRAFARVEQLVDEALRRGIPNWQVLEDSLEDPEEKEALARIRGLRNADETSAPWSRRSDPIDPPGIFLEKAYPVPLLPPGANTEVTRRTWGKLVIVRRLGRGAFGDVLLAHDPDLDREVALKLFRIPDRSRALLLSRADSARGRQAMVREGRLMARVRHPNVVAIYGAEEIEGEAGIWMDFIEGETLHELVTRQGRLGAQEAALIGLDLCRALAALHARGIVHRDVKAQNVMREEGGRIVLMDFGVGIEVQTSAGTVEDLPAGTPLYMAPEMLLEGSASAASDQYALGVLLYFLVTGAYPTGGKSLPALVEDQRSGRRRLLRDARSDLPLPFIEVVERAMNADPNGRFTSMGEMEQALAGVLGTVTTVGRGGATRVRPRQGIAERSGARQEDVTPPRWRRASRLWAVLLTVLTVAAAGGLLVVLRTVRPPRPVPVPRQITFHGLVSDGEISPDGRNIAYIALDPSSAWSLMVQDVKGGPPRKLYGASGTQAMSLRWRRDGSAVLVAAFGEQDSLRTGIFSCPAEGGASTKIGPRAAYIAVSPAGDQVFAASLSWEGRYTLRDGPTATREAHQVAGRTGWLTGVDWGGPDGRFLFNERSKSTGAHTILASDPGTSEAVPIWADSSGIAIFPARWAPTQNAIYMLRSRGLLAQPDLVKVDLSKRLPSRRPEVLFSGLGPKHFSVSADGRRLALTRAEVRSSIWRFTFGESPGSLDSRRLATGGRKDLVSEISPDGRSIVFDRATTSEQICTMSIDGTLERQLTHERGGASFPSWSPDGRSLAYLTQIRDTLRVCVVPADGGERRVFGRSAGSQGLRWFRSGPIVYQRPDSRNFTILDPVTEVERPLVQVDSVGWMSNPCVSPDGRYVAVSWNRTPGTALWVIDLETGAERRLTSSHLEPVTWSSDGTGIWAVEASAWGPDGAGTTAKLERISASDGSLDGVYDLPFSAEEQISGLAVAPDDSFFIVSVVEVQSDIWLVDNFDPGVR